VVFDFTFAHGKIIEIEILADPELPRQLMRQARDVRAPGSSGLT
jgi:hypothetical protein